MYQRLVSNPPSPDRCFALGAAFARMGSSRAECSRSPVPRAKIKEQEKTTFPRPDITELSARVVIAILCGFFDFARKRKTRKGRLTEFLVYPGILIYLLTYLLTYLPRGNVGELVKRILIYCELEILYQIYRIGESLRKFPEVDERTSFRQKEQTLPFPIHLLDRNV